MFETSVVRAQARAATRPLGLLTASIIAHTSIVIGAVAVSIASVDFPATAPAEYALAPVFEAVQIPPPLGNPNGGARPQAAQQAPVQQQVRPNEVTAPGVVPDTITPLAPVGTGDSGGSATGTEPGPVGVPWGTAGSIGDLDAPPVVDVPVQEPEEKIYLPHEVVAPVLLQRVDPRYPPALGRTGVSATVVVRCVIDKSGRVRDAEVIVPAAMAPFNAEVLNVVSQWRYKPATYGGKAVDSYLNLTVNFSVKR